MDTSVLGVSAPTLAQSDRRGGESSPCNSNAEEPADAACIVVSAMTISKAAPLQQQDAPKLPQPAGCRNVQGEAREKLPEVPLEKRLQLVQQRELRVQQRESLVQQREALVQQKDAELKALKIELEEREEKLLEDEAEVMEDRGRLQEELEKTANLEGREAQLLAATQHFQLQQQQYNILQQQFQTQLQQLQTDQQQLKAAEDQLTAGQSQLKADMMENLQMQAKLCVQQQYQSVSLKAAQNTGAVWRARMSALEKLEAELELQQQQLHKEREALDHAQKGRSLAVIKEEGEVPEAATRGRMHSPATAGGTVTIINKPELM